jgi:hypothetical protein
MMRKSEKIKKHISGVIVGMLITCMIGIIFSSGANAVENSYASTSYIKITSGTFTGLTYNTLDKAIEVQPSGSISGSFDISIYNSGPGSAVYAIGATSTWGTHSSSYQSVGTSGTGSSTKEISISLTAPSTVGTYYYLIAGGWEYNGGQVISGTNWAIGTLHWDDSNDVADWSASQISSARSDGLTTGQVETSSGTYKDFYIPADALKIVVATSSGGSSAVENSYASTSYIKITSGTFTGLTYNTLDKAIEVQPSGSISGSFDISIYNSGPSSAVYAIGATSTWGTHSSSYQSVGTSGTGSSTKEISISLTAPSTVGTYYYLIAGGWEYNGGQVISGTNWAIGTLHWDDSNDVADWSASQISSARSDGLTTGQVETSSGTYKDFYIPADALKIVVATSSDGGGDDNSGDSGTTDWTPIIIIAIIVAVAIIGIGVAVYMRKPPQPPIYNQHPQQYPPQEPPPYQQPPNYPPPPPPQGP